MDDESKSNSRSSLFFKRISSWRAMSACEHTPMGTCTRVPAKKRNGWLCFNGSPVFTCKGLFPLFIINDVFLDKSRKPTFLFFSLRIYLLREELRPFSSSLPRNLKICWGVCWVTIGKEQAVVRSNVEFLPESLCFFPGDRMQLWVLFSGSKQFKKFTQLCSQK